MINKKSLEILEYNQILALIAENSYSKPGKDKILSLTPSNDFNEVKTLLNQTSEADQLMYEFCCNISFAFDECLEYLELAHKSIMLTCEQLLKIARLIRVASVAKKDIFKAPEGKCELLKEISNNIFVPSHLQEKINKSIISDNEVSSNASEKLFNIRNAIASTNRKIREKLLSYTSNSSLSSYLQDNLVTIRNNRYVIPVKTEYKSFVKGLIHDQSASGATTFIEPIAIVDLNNELRSLQIEENIEIENILRNLSYEVDYSYNELKQSYFTLIDLDVIFAKAAYSRKIKGVMPIINKDGIIDIKNGRHPLIDKDKVVAVSISLGKEYNTLVISGPNTGGKTVSIKLVGLLSIMATTGIFVPCGEGTNIAVFDDVLSCIGDDQSIENNLSTFSAHLYSIINIVNNAKENTLVLLDELGSGTDPVEGSALAIAVIEYLRNKKAKTIVTSHFKELKEYAYSVEDINIAGMDFDPTTFKPTYNLLMGQTASSNALEIALLLGLNKDIVSKAKSLISKEDIAFNNIIKGAEINRREAARMKEEAEKTLEESKLKLAQYEKLIAEVEIKKERLEEKMKKSAKEVLGDYLDEADELVNQIKDLVKQGDEQALFEARKTKKKLENMQNSDFGEQIHFDKISGKLNVGDDVYVKALNSTATIIEISKNGIDCVVKMGILTTKCKIKDLQKIKITNKPIKKVPEKIGYNMEHFMSIKNEINLLGKNVDEATIQLDSYLLEAKAKGYKEVRIIHGKGTGALRKGVHEYLKKVKIVDSFRLGGYGEGDLGVTIVVFKE